jgi:hypothetical protein
MLSKSLEILAKHDVGDYEVYVKEDDGKLHLLCTIPFEKSEVISLLALLKNLLSVVQNAAKGKKVDWAHIAGRCQRDIAAARQHPKPKKFEFQ